MKVIIFIFLSIISCTEIIEISIKLNGNQSLLYKDFQPTPNSILINWIKSIINLGKVSLSKNNSIITLKWENKLTNCAKMFYGCKNITSIDLTKSDLTSVANMNSMFYGCSSLTSIKFKDGIISNVEDMSHMFDGCSSLNPSNLINNFDTSKVTDMSNMFSDTKLSSFNFSKFVVSKVKSMSSMFSWCTSLKSITLSSSDLIVTNINSMFYHCNILNSLNFIKFRTSKVTNMGYLFYYCSSLTSVINLDTSKATNMDYMFSLTKLSAFNFGEYDLSSVINMEHMFSGCSSLISITLPFNN